MPTAGPKRQSETTSASSGNYRPPEWCGFPGEKAKWLWLEIMKSNVTVGKFDLLKKPCNVAGRDKRCELVLKHLSLSRQHAALVHHSGKGVGLFLIDLGSKHGTYVEDKRVRANKPVRIVPGMKVRFGASTRYFILRDSDPRRRNPVVRSGSGEDKLARKNQDLGMRKAHTPANTLKTKRDEARGNSKSGSRGLKSQTSLESGSDEDKDGEEEKAGGKEKSEGDDARKDSQNETGETEELRKKRRMIMIMKQKAALKRKRSLIPKARSLTSLYGTLPTEEVEERKSKVIERLAPKKKDSDENQTVKKTKVEAKDSQPALKPIAVNKEANGK
mmetsp:Transcript_19007/g.26506  ORF Transcript_19007/g.26506 Transcript_19007/m.26506 type:complete len:331 (+) Transcript_19007:74-1066(+)